VRRRHAAGALRSDGLATPRRALRALVGPRRGRPIATHERPQSPGTNLMRQSGNILSRGNTCGRSNCRGAARCHRARCQSGRPRATPCNTVIEHSAGHADLEDAVRRAIGACRPAWERWTVRIREATDGIIAVELARGWEAPESFTFGVDGDDGAHSGLIATTCQFLRNRWPDSFTPS
jgi:hypothetical protein